MDFATGRPRLGARFPGKRGAVSEFRAPYLAGIAWQLQVGLRFTVFYIHAIQKSHIINQPAILPIPFEGSSPTADQWAESEKPYFRAGVRNSPVIS